LISRSSFKGNNLDGTKYENAEIYVLKAREWKPELKFREMEIAARIEIEIVLS
jgi:hypothetical protein